MTTIPNPPASSNPASTPMTSNPSAPNPTPWQAFNKWSTAAKTAKTTEKRNWLKDITSDANGISLQRVQVLLWSVVLGIIFLVSVVTTLSMPTFSDTLLLLIGISSGTYLGLKIPEQTKAN